jgi:outer membrane lipoprotein-sorting protein
MGWLYIAIFILLLIVNCGFILAKGINLLRAFISNCKNKENELKDFSSTRTLDDNREGTFDLKNRKL